MLDKFTTLTPALYEYMVQHRSERDPVREELIQATAELGALSLMQIAPEQGAFMTMLTQLVGARRAIEVGTFTGYSALCIAQGLPEDGRLICCDVNAEWTAIGKRHWEKAGVAHKIDLRLAPGLETLRSLREDTPIDLAFIDADKVNYAHYYEEILKRLRPNGVLLFDNVLWMGQVLDVSSPSPDTQAIRALNALLANDKRVDCVMLPIADGLTVVRKR